MQRKIFDSINKLYGKCLISLHLNSFFVIYLSVLNFILNNCLRGCFLLCGTFYQKIYECVVFT